MPTANPGPKDGPALVGEIIAGRYRLDAVIGAGGMSTVFRAWDATLERPVALKLMRLDLTDDEQQLERFRREARAAARLSHPNVVTVIDAGEEDGRPFIVFEYVEGETLKQRIKRLGRLGIDEAVAYAIEIAKALQAAHMCNIVHRDVKPQNVMLDREGHAKVGDFGIARELEVDGLTKTGRVLGTTDYVSPEQAIGDRVTGQSDIYSLGVVLYEMLTGNVPFKGENYVSIAMKHVKEPMPDVLISRPEVSASLAAVLDKMVAKELAKRYLTAEDAVRELEFALAFEVARSGQSTGEATALLDALPRRSQRFLPSTARGLPRAWIRPALILVALIVAGLLLADNLHKGPGSNERVRRSGNSPVVPLHRAHVFDPPPGDGKEHNSRVGQVLDGNPGTTWTTETYSDGEFSRGKTGVGIYVDAGSAVVARIAEIQTPQNDLTVEIRATNERPRTLSDWTQVGSASGDFDSKPIELNGSIGFRYYLVWITDLSSDGAAEISEFQLRR